MRPPTSKPSEAALGAQNGRASRQFSLPFSITRVCMPSLSILALPKPSLSCVLLRPEMGRRWRQRQARQKSTARPPRAFAPPRLLHDRSIPLTHTAHHRSFRRPMAAGAAPEANGVHTPAAPAPAASRRRRRREARAWPAAGAAAGAALPIVIVVTIASTLSTADGFHLPVPPLQARQSPFQLRPSRQLRCVGRGSLSS